MEWSRDRLTQGSTWTCRDVAIRPEVEYLRMRSEGLAPIRRRGANGSRATIEAVFAGGHRVAAERDPKDEAPIVDRGVVRRAGGAGLRRCGAGGGR